MLHLPVVRLAVRQGGDEPGKGVGLSPTVPDVGSCLRPPRLEARDPVAERIRRIGRLLQQDRVVVEIVGQHRVASRREEAPGELLELRPGIEPCRDEVEQLADAGLPILVGQELFELPPSRRQGLTIDRTGEDALAQEGARRQVGRLLPPRRGAVVGDRPEARRRFVECAAVEVRGGDLVGAVGGEHRRQVRLRRGGEAEAPAAVGEHGVLRIDPGAHTGAVGAEDRGPGPQSLGSPDERVRQAVRVPLPRADLSVEPDFLVRPTSDDRACVHPRADQVGRIRRRSAAEATLPEPHRRAYFLVVERVTGEMAVRDGEVRTGVAREQHAEAATGECVEGSVGAARVGEDRPVLDHARLRRPHRAECDDEQHEAAPHGCHRLPVFP